MMSLALGAVALALQLQSSPDDLDRIVRAQADSGFSGVVLVAHGDSVVFERAYGQVDGRPMTTGRRFNLASITKGFTAAAILALQRAGTLSLDDSIGRFFPDAPPEKRGISVRQLLTHISGIEGGLAGSGFARRDDAIRAILAEPQTHAAGTYYRYMDDDYVLLAGIIEVASRTTWERYLDRTLLGPLGLSQSGFQGGDWAHRGADGMTSTARDLLRWIRAIEQGEVVSSTVSAELRRPLLFLRRDPPFRIYYGYGTRVYERGGRVVEIVHSGAGDDGHTAIVRVLENGDVVVVLASSGRRGNTTWASYVANRVSPRR